MLSQFVIAVGSKFNFHVLVALSLSLSRSRSFPALSSCNTPKGGKSEGKLDGNCGWSCEFAGLLQHDGMRPGVRDPHTLGAELMQCRGKVAVAFAGKCNDWKSIFKPAKRTRNLV